MIFEPDKKRETVSYRATIPKGGIRIGPGESVVLPLQAVTRSVRAYSGMRRAIVWAVVVSLLAMGFFLVNSAKGTCSLVGCPGWCQSGGISCGMPIPSGGWQPGQTVWK